MSRSMYKLGLLSMVVATGLAVTSNGFASDAQRVDVITHLSAEGSQGDSMKAASGQSTRVDLIGSIGSQGPVYPSTSEAMRVDVITHLPAEGGSLKSASGQPAQVDVVGIIGSVLDSVGIRGPIAPSTSGTMRVDIITHLPEEGVQGDSLKSASGQSTRVDLIGSIGSQGPVYPSTSGAMRVDVITRTRV